jgi:hypothetical protein
LSVNGGRNTDARVICPSCFEVYGLDQVKWFTKGPDNRLTPIEPPAPAAPKGLYNRIMRIFVEPEEPPPVDVSGLDRVGLCPFCGYELPDNIESVKSIVIGLAGGGTSGKGHLIASMIRDLRDEGGLSGNGCQPVIPLGETRARFHDEYFAPLFERHERLIGTDPLRTDQRNKPLVFLLTIQSGDARQSYNLMLFDAAGEQIDDDADRHRFHSYLLHADGIIFVADPVALEKVRREMGAALRPENEPTRAPAKKPARRSRTVVAGTAWDPGLGEVESSSEPATDGNEEDAPASGPLRANGAENEPVRRQPHETILSITRDLRRSRHLPEGSQVNIPAALVVTKGDLLRYARSSKDWVEQVMPPRSKALHKYHRIEILERSARTKEMLEIIAPAGLLKAMDSFNNVSYHTVSATNSQHRDDGRTYPKVEPRNVLEPLASLLYKLGYFNDV